MKVNELMIGNWFYRYCCNDQIMEVRAGGVIGLDKHRGIISLHEMQPIPITFDWLIKNGFKKEYEELCFSKEIDGYYIDITFVISNRCEGHVVCHVDNNDRQTVGCADILYIHQLQNLLNILNIKEEFIV